MVTSDESGWPQDTVRDISPTSTSVGGERVRAPRIRERRTRRALASRPRLVPFPQYALCTSGSHSIVFSSMSDRMRSTDASPIFLSFFPWLSHGHQPFVLPAGRASTFPSTPVRHSPIPCLVRSLILHPHREKERDREREGERVGWVDRSDGGTCRCVWDERRRRRWCFAHTRGRNT